MLHYKNLIEEYEDDEKFFAYLEETDVDVNTTNDELLLLSNITDDNNRKYNIIVDNNNYRKIISFCGHSDIDTMSFLNNDVELDDYNIYKIKYGIRFVLFHHNNEWVIFSQDFSVNLITIKQNETVDLSDFFERSCSDNNFEYDTLLDKTNTYIFDIVYKERTGQYKEKIEMYHVATRENTNFELIDYNIDEILHLSKVEFQDFSIMYKMITTTKSEYDLAGFTFIDKEGNIFDVHTNFHKYLIDNLYFNVYNTFAQYKLLRKNKKIGKYITTFAPVILDNDITDFAGNHDFINSYVVNMFIKFKLNGYHEILPEHDYYNITGTINNYNYYYRFETEMVNMFEDYIWKTSWCHTNSIDIIKTDEYNNFSLNAIFTASLCDFKFACLLSFNNILI